MKVPVVTGLNEEDRRNARRVLHRHRPAAPVDRRDGGPVTCRACGQPYPCLPRRIAETTVDPPNDNEGAVA